MDVVTLKAIAGEFDVATFSLTLDNYPLYNFLEGEEAGDYRTLIWGLPRNEVRKQYVVTARAKGLRERALIFKYPVRIALNPIVATIGWQLTAIISGAPIVAMVLSLPTTGPLMINALLLQDMYLAGSFILLLCTFTVVGTFISDVLLAMLDPRIRLGAEQDGG